MIIGARSAPGGDFLQPDGGSLTHSKSGVPGTSDVVRIILDMGFVQIGNRGTISSSLKKPR